MQSIFRCLKYDQATKYIYAMIHFQLCLEVLAKFWSLRLSMQSILRNIFMEVLVKFWSLRVSDQSIFPLCMSLAYKICSCNNLFIATSGSSREILEPMTLNAIYLLMYCVVRLRNMFMQSSFHRYIWKY